MRRYRLLRNDGEAAWTSLRGEAEAIHATAAVLRNDRGREGFRLPSLRTVRAVFPHTALQSVVSSSGLSRLPPGCFEGEQPRRGEESIGPTYSVLGGSAATGSFLLLAQHRSQPSAHEGVDVLEAGGRVLEVAKPALERGIERRDRAGEALSARPFGLGPDPVPKAQNAFLSHEPVPGLEAIAEELEALPLDPAIPDAGFGRVQGQAILVREGSDQRKGFLRFLHAVAQDDLGFLSEKPKNSAGYTTLWVCKFATAVSRIKR